MLNLELRIPPVLIVAAAAAIMWLSSRVLPGLHGALPGSRLAAGALALLGLAVVTLGLVEFRRARTTVNPLRPADASMLVTTGVYAWSRNPMYLGFALMLLAWAVYLSNPVSVLVLLLFVAYVGRFQIVPEERALQRTFGADFDRYRKRVRRWL